MNTKMQAVMRPGRIRQEDVSEGLDRAGAQVLGGRQLGEIEAVERRVQNQHGEWDIDVDEDD